MINLIISPEFATSIDKSHLQRKVTDLVENRYALFTSVLYHK